MSHATTRPVRLRVHDTRLCCQVLRRVGWGATCACGYEGPTRRNSDDAREDSIVHSEVCNRKSPSTELTA